MLPDEIVVSRNQNRGCNASIDLNGSNHDRQSKRGELLSSTSIQSLAESPLKRRKAVLRKRAQNEHGIDSPTRAGQRSFWNNGLHGSNLPLVHVKIRAKKSEKFSPNI